jgi:hypothetical protein
MHTIQLRKLPEDIYEGVKKSAKIAKRSMTQQVIYVLDAYLKQQTIEQEAQIRKLAALDNIKQLHKQAPLPTMPTEWLTEDKK